MWDKREESSSCQCVEMAGILEPSKEIQLWVNQDTHSGPLKSLVSPNSGDTSVPKVITRTTEEEGAAKDNKASGQGILHL